MGLHTKRPVCLTVLPTHTHTPAIISTSGPRINALCRHGSMPCVGKTVRSFTSASNEDCTVTDPSARRCRSHDYLRTSGHQAPTKIDWIHRTRRRGYSPAWPEYCCCCRQSEPATCHCLVKFTTSTYGCPRGSRGFRVAQKSQYHPRVQQIK